MLTIEVVIERPAHRYEILLEPGLGANWRAEVAERIGAGSYLALVDTNVARLYGYPESGQVDSSWHYLWIEPGENNKNLRQYCELCEKALAFDIDRETVVVAVGGGMTGDLAGYLAATLLRGLGFVHVPTSLVAQVDGSVGGKNGVNVHAGKTVIGTVRQPDLVLIDPAFLATLPPRELTAGFAEVVKTAFLEGPDFFRQLQQSKDLLLSMNHGFMAGVVARCCRFKTDIIVGDEHDKGRRQLLALGHSFGHALEALAGYDGRVNHGEAVAVGLALICEFSARRGILSTEERDEVKKLLEDLHLPVAIGRLGARSPQPPDWRALLSGDKAMAALTGDKKLDGGRLSLVVPYAIGDCRVEAGYTAREALSFLRGCIDG